MRRNVLNRALDLFGLGLHGEYAEDADPQDFVHEEEDGVYALSPQNSAGQAACPLVRAEPRDMDDATAIANEIKRRVPVILNLENCNPEDARRIRDFLGGVTYGMSGFMKKIGSWVYACAPFDMPIQRLVLEGGQLGQPRYERDDESAED
jgi:FtsZ-interacting cell division protein YlmF